MIARRLAFAVALALAPLAAVAEPLHDPGIAVPRYTVVPVLIDKDVRVGGAGTQLQEKTVKAQVAQDVVVNGMLVIKAGDLVEGHLSTEKNVTRRVFSVDISQEADLNLDDVITYCGDTIHIKFERTFVGGVRDGFLSFGAHAHDAVFDRGLILRAETDRLERSVCATRADHVAPALPAGMVVSEAELETSEARTNRLDDQHVAAVAAGTAGPRSQTFDLPLPDPILTPGDIANRSINDVCFPGFDEDQGYLRPEAVKEAFKRYQIPAPLQLHRYVIDRLVPASLGGSGEITNLWAVPLEAERRKRYIEEALQQQVCSGNISLADAQHRMLTDWRAAVTW